MRVDVLTLFPEMITDYCNQSILKIAQQNNLLEVHAHNPRDYSTDKHKAVDDTPYGGGSGMLLGPQPFYDCYEDLGLDLQEGNYEVIITAPSGKPYNQAMARELAKKKNLVILCGRYEGFDERIKKLASLEVSMGDYVLTGGELAALTIIDSTSRLIPGVLGDSESSEVESFETKDYLNELKEAGVSKRELEEFLDKVGFDKDKLKSLSLLEYPQFTRPKEFKGQVVPDVLDSGHHKNILLWRLEQAIKNTQEKRPDLLN